MSVCIILLAIGNILNCVNINKILKRIELLENSSYIKACLRLENELNKYCKEWIENKK